MQTILKAENLSKSFGELELFSNISFIINKGEKVAIIAKNGAGKTTLLNILTKVDDFNSGNVEWHPDINYSYLPQEPELNQENTILDEVFGIETPQTKTIKEYERAIHFNDIGSINRLTPEMDHLNLWDYEIRVKTILSRLNLEEYDKKVKELSGGQRKRVGLAKALINEPDFLILDEPTNHLDVKSIEWLEDYLVRSNLTLLMVTHDRYFMDRICNCILELDDIRNEMHRYEGNYENYLRRREERIHAENQEVEKAKNTLRTEEEWMRRMPKARGTKAKYRIDKVHELRNVAANKRHEEQVRIQSKETRLGKKISEFKDVSYYWDDVPYLKDFTYSFTRMDKIGILGKNGSGKSTFLDILTNHLTPATGNIEIGETVKFGYYRQKGMDFDDQARVIDAVQEIAETLKIDEKTTISASQFLTYFLFPPKRQYDYIYKLSGGEKRRLYLCTILMQNPNFLILDEPTNDLDIATLEVLEDYLSAFKGCVIVVSHDRYFMDAIVDHLFVFRGDATIKDFPGNYSQYFEKQKEEEKAIETVKKKDAPVQDKQEKKNSNKLSYKEKREFESLEKELEELNSEKAELEELLNSGSLNPDELQEKSNRIGQIIDLLDEKEMRWLELSEKE